MQIIKISRSDITEDIITEYFNNMKESVKDVPAENVWNYVG